MPRLAKASFRKGKNWEVGLYRRALPWRWSKEQAESRLECEKEIPAVTAEFTEKRDKQNSILREWLRIELNTVLRIQLIGNQFRYNVAHLA